MTEKKQSTSADEIGPALHTALRKCCDSDPTTYAWNVIHLLTGTWTAFCNAVGEAEATTGPQLKTVWGSNGWWPRDVADGESFYARVIFRCALDDFDDDDWYGFASFLGDPS